MLERLKGVLALDSGTFEEIEHDPSAMTQAILVVVVSSILAAIGGSFGQVLFGVGIGLDEETTFRFISIALWAIAAWVIWSAVAWFIGTKIFKGNATLPEMMRVVGFAYAPLAFQVLGVIPIVGVFIPWLVAIWSVAAVFVAVGAVLDLTNGVQVAITAIAGWLVYLVGMGILLNVF